MSKTFSFWRNVYFIPPSSPGPPPPLVSVVSVIKKNKNIDNSIRSGHKHHKLWIKLSQMVLNKVLETWLYKIFHGQLDLIRLAVNKAKKDGTIDALWNLHRRA